jgi:hypothetical protein
MDDRRIGVQFHRMLLEVENYSTVQRRTTTVRVCATSEVTLGAATLADVRQERNFPNFLHLQTSLTPWKIRSLEKCSS